MHIQIQSLRPTSAVFLVATRLNWLLFYVITVPSKSACFTGKQVITGQGCVDNHILHARHQADHQCEKLETAAKGMLQTRALVETILSSEDHRATPPAGLKKPRSVKAQKTAAKVQLMKLKMKSSGDNSLPQTERVYFLVKLKPKLPKLFNVKTLQVTPPGGRPARGAWVSSRYFSKFSRYPPNYFYLTII